MWVIVRPVVRSNNRQVGQFPQFKRRERWGRGSEGSVWCGLSNLTCNVLKTLPRVADLCGALGLCGANLVNQPTPLQALQITTGKSASSHSSKRGSDGGRCSVLKTCGIRGIAVRRK